MAKITDREVMEDTFSAYFFNLIQRNTETKKFERLLLAARDQFIKEATFDELEQEIIDLI